MSDALTPLRQVYGLEPDARAGSPEHEALRGMREVLDAHPSPVPSPEVVAAVLARAAERPDALTFESERQAAALAPVLDALDRVPRPRPSQAVVAHVLARAAQSAASLDAVRHVYAEGPAPPAETPAAREVDMLSQSREAIQRAIAGRPRVQPSTAAVDAVLARAAEAVSDPDAIPVTSPVEAALIDQSLQALDRLPRLAPSAAARDAVLVAAATASAALATPALGPADRPAAPGRTPARDRAPAVARRRPVGMWAGASALVLAALVAVAVLPRGAAEPEPVAAAESIEEADDSPSLASPTPEASPEPVDEVAAAPTAPSGSALVASAAIASYVPVVERPTPAPAAPAPVASPTAPVRSSQAAAAAVPAPPSWEASDDVRALSLRLQELEDDALAWDEPAEAFGAPAARALTASPGLQSVRSGGPARARMIDTTDQR